MTQLTIVGGIYREKMMWPASDEVYGSAGRAACSIAVMGASVALYGYADTVADEVMAGNAMHYGFSWHPTAIEQGVAFRYTHGLAKPEISRWSIDVPEIEVSGTHVLRYGMLEGAPRVSADYAVYDPQNTDNPEWFRANGSMAKHLAVVLNEHEARTLLGKQLPPEKLLDEVARAENAEVVILKQGARGALVFDKGIVQPIPAFETFGVSKLGSGDQFSAQFARAWLVDGLGATEAALQASKATAYYCEQSKFPTREELTTFDPAPLAPGPMRQEGRQATVYLAGPFFKLSELWIIEEARDQLFAMGLNVFSPFHDIGPGPAGIVVPADIKAIAECDFIYAITDGLDSGTIYEIGYARALGKPVVVYAETESPEDLKMMEGSDCFICRDFVSSIYRAGWIGASM